LVSPTPAQLEFAASRLTTEGCIYAEMQSAWGSAEERKRLFFTNIFVGIESYLTTLHRLGFAEASTYWHRPSFEKSLQLIPLNDQLALAFVFSQRAADLFSQLKLATGRSLLKTDWLLRLFQSVSLIACRLPANGK